MSKQGKMGTHFPFHAAQVLTLVTTIFCPAQFLCGVYGMNFVDDTGRPAIPELLWKNGYLYFWLLIVGYLSLGGFWRSGKGKESVEQ